MSRFLPNFSLKRRLILATAASMALLCGSALADEKIKLKFADWMPLTHYTVTNAAQPFMAKATELSKGQIEFQYFPSEQLGKAKDLLTLLQSGAADIVDISPAYISDKFPLSSVAELPAMFTTSCEGTRAYASLVKDGGILAEKEFKPLGIRVLTSVAYAPYQVTTVNRKVESLKDFAGLKIRTAGGAMDITTTRLGAVPVRMPGPDILPSMSRGTLDGSLVPLQSMKVFDLQTVAKHMSTDLSLGSFITVYAISERAWNKLSPELRTALSRAGDFATENHCNYVDTNEPKVVAELEKAGVKSSSIAPAQVKVINEHLTQVATDWAANLDKRNRPGGAVLADFRKALGK